MAKVYNDFKNYDLMPKMKQYFSETKPKEFDSEVVQKKSGKMENEEKEASRKPSLQDLLKGNSKDVKMGARLISMSLQVEQNEVFLKELKECLKTIEGELEKEHLSDFAKLADNEKKLLEIVDESELISEQLQEIESHPRLKGGRNGVIFDSSTCALNCSCGRESVASKLKKISDNMSLYGDGIIILKNVLDEPDDQEDPEDQDNQNEPNEPDEPDDSYEKDNSDSKTNFDLPRIIGSELSLPVVEYENL